MMTPEQAGPGGTSSHRFDPTGSAPAGHDGRRLASTESGPGCTGRRDRRRAGPGGSASGLGTAIRRFGHGEHGAVAIESAIAIVILVVGFAGLMEVVQACYTDDRMSRAARAAARVLALDPTADTCAAIRRELRLAEEFDCDTATWTLTVHPGVSPDALPSTPDGSVTFGTGDMVLVWIEWNREAWTFGGAPRDANAEDAIETTDDELTDETTDETTDELTDELADETEAGTDGVPMIALGLARCELELCGQEAG